MTDKDDIKTLIDKYKHRLQLRREQKATFGISADPSIDIEIEDLRAEIAKLQAELVELEEQDVSPTSNKPGPTSSSESDASPGRPRRIFLCHAGEDKPQVIKLYDQLKAAGYHPWLDKKDLLPGQDWRREIEKIIRDPYSVILICLSNRSTTKRGVVQQEIKWTLDMLDQMPEDTIYLIPARLEECQVPDRLSGLHWVDLFEPDGFTQLTRALDFEISK